MRLFIFIHSLCGGGAERVTVNLANYWADKGWKITIVTTAGHETDFYELHPGILRIALQLEENSNSLFAAIRHNLRRIRALRAVLKLEKPDVALGMMNTANCLLAIAAIGTGISTIGSERIHPPKLAIGRSWSWLRRMTYPHLTAVVAQTKASAQWLQMHTGTHQIRVIPNPVNYPLACHEPRVVPCTIISDDNGDNILLSVGRLVPQKGFDRLLIAFAELAPRFPSWNLAIVGDGDCRNELENQIIQFGLEGRVFLPGAVGNISEWYEAADIFVMTSHFEGFPNTLVEALAHGLPAVSVDCETGPSEILRHEFDGLLVPQDNIEALIGALSRLMKDSSLRLCFGERAIEARVRFAMEKIAAMWEKIFDEVRK